jgi:hypothetical protein
LTGGLHAINGPDDPDDVNELNGITIFHDNDEQGTLIGEPFAVLASHENFNQQPPPGSSTNLVPTSHDDPEAPPLPEFCTECDFLKWGVFGTAATFEEEESETGARDVAIVGFWVAGDIAAVGDLPLMGSATYDGDAIGTVSTDLFGSQEPYTARGDMEMTWNFQSRSGDMTISKFDQDHFGEDGVTFGGPLCAPGVTACGTNDKAWSTPNGNHFGGPLTSRGNNPNEPRDLNGFAVGSFARGSAKNDNGNPTTGTPVKGSTPQGVMGNWQVGTGPDTPAGSRYQASGVFGGRLRD